MKSTHLLASLSVCLLFLAAHTHTRAQDTGNVGENIVRGNIVCIEINAQGNVRVSEDFIECTGLVYLLGVDGRIYSIHGSVEEMEKISASSKTRMGYRLPLRLKGTQTGHQRAWRLYTQELGGDEADTANVTVTGKVMCLFPNYRDGSIDPMVATEPCNEHEDHAHLIYTKDAKTYAVHGPYEKIVEIEQSSKRGNVTITGKVQGNQGGWIIYVN